MPQTSCSSIQAQLMVSHISLVSAVRTERELSRAASMQFLIEEGLRRRERQIFDDVLFVGFVIGLVEAGADAGGEQRRIPFIGLADIGGGQRGDAKRRVDGAREIFRPLDIAGQPVQVFGGARQHAKALALYSSRIQVSLVPPPWLELTTSEPSFSATRVRPPGTMVTRVAPGQHERAQIDVARREARRGTGRAGRQRQRRLGDITFGLAP